MNIANLLAPERIRAGAEATSKKRTLELLSELLTGDAGDPETRNVLESLISRERLGATGLGRGVALPHARVASVTQPMAALVRLDDAVDFDAIDKQRVDLLFALLVPEDSTDEHLRLLRSLAEMFRDTEFCEELRASQTPDEMYQQILDWQDQHGAA
jgi:PTS system nitrogen regulatory IIA component